MVNNYEDLKKEIRNSAKTPEEIGKIFAKHGITPDNPEELQRVLEKAGIKEEVTPEKAENMIKKVTEDLPKDVKRSLANMILEMSENVSQIPMPDDLKEMLREWKKEEN